MGTEKSISFAPIDRNFTSGKMKTRMALIEQSIAEFC